MIHNKQTVTIWFKEMNEEIVDLPRGQDNPIPPLTLIIYVTMTHDHYGTMTHDHYGRTSVTVPLIIHTEHSHTGCPPLVLLILTVF